MKNTLRILRVLSQLSKQQWLWLAVLYPLSGLAWLLTLFSHHHRLGRLLGVFHRNTELIVLATEVQQLKAWQLGKLVEALSKYTPWPSKCLVQALICRFALYYYDIPHVLYIGICKPTEPEQALPSHAWLCVDRWVITGREGVQSFSIIATYVSSKEILTPIP